MAVLDWELSTIGDPLADFTLSPDGSGTCRRRTPARGPVRWSASISAHSAFPSLADLRRDVSCADQASIRGRISPTYLAYNFFRIAAILQGIAGRVRDGTATSEHAPAKAQMVRPLAETAWRFAREAGAK